MGGLTIRGSARWQRRNRSTAVPLGYFLETHGGINAARWERVLIGLHIGPAQQHMSFGARIPEVERSVYRRDAIQQMHVVTCALKDWRVVRTPVTGRIIQPDQIYSSSAFRRD